MNTSKKISVARCEYSAYTQYGFNQYHYLAGINKSARCFLFYLDGKIAGFCAVVNHTYRGCSRGVRFHRVVVLPQFSHRGLGGMICDFIAGIFQNDDYKVYMTCRCIELGTYMGEHTNNWKATANNLRKRKNNTSEGKRYKNRTKDICFCYKYIGENITGYDNLLLTIAELRKNSGLYILNSITEEKVTDRLQKKQTITSRKKVNSSFVFHKATPTFMVKLGNYSQMTTVSNLYFMDSINKKISSKMLMRKCMSPHDSHGRSIGCRLFSG